MTKAERAELAAAGVKNVKLYREAFNAGHGDYCKYWDRKGSGKGWKAQPQSAISRVTGAAPTQHGGTTHTHWCQWVYVVNNN